MKKLLSSIFIILLIGIITDCTKMTPVGPEENEPITQVQLKKEQIKEYWFSDYMPLIPGLYGIKTYEDGSEQFTSEIVGSETIHYGTGDITGVKIVFGDDLYVFYNDKRSFYWLLKEGDYIFSTDCDLTAFPPGAIIGKIYDGMILKMYSPGSARKVNSMDSEDCEPCGPVEGGGSDSGIQLVSIQDVYIYGKRYNNAIILWELEPSLSFIELNFKGIEHELGLRLPTSNDTGGMAIDGLLIFGRQKGILAFGDVLLDNGRLEGFFELVSVSHKGSTDLIVGKWDLVSVDWSEYENDIKVDGSVSTDDFQYLEFTANMKINIYDSGMLDDSGTYKIDGTTLTLTGIGDEVSEFDIATLTNTDLILVGEDSYEEGGSIWKEVVTVTLERRN